MDPASPPLAATGAGALPELALVDATLAASVAEQPERWAALSGCARVQLYTAGAAPAVRGAGAGAAVVVEGQGARAVAPPLLRLTLATPLPAVPPDPAGRAALVGLVLGQAVLLRLAQQGWSGTVGPLWTTHPAAVIGPAAPPPHRDLGSALAHQQHLLRWAVPEGVRIAPWPAGEGGGSEVADLALAAAFAGDTAAVTRYRALRVPRLPTVPPALSNRPPLETDYVLVLGDRPAVGQLVGTPTYRLWTRDGRSRRGTGPAAAGGPAGGTWASLLAALTDLTERIAQQQRDPARYTLTVYSSQESVVAVLRDLAPGPPASARQAQVLLRRFGTAHILWQPAALLAVWLEAV